MSLDAVSNYELTPLEVIGILRDWFQCEVLVKVVNEYTLETIDFKVLKEGKVIYTIYYFWFSWNVIFEETKEEIIGYKEDLYSLLKRIERRKHK